MMISHAAPSARTTYLTSKGLTWGVNVTDIRKFTTQRVARTRRTEYCLCYTAAKPKLDNFKEQLGTSDVYYLYTCTKARL
jgi:hypothetical protein